jgi:hypothetical protein
MTVPLVQGVGKTNAESIEARMMLGEQIDLLDSIEIIVNNNQLEW